MPFKRTLKEMLDRIPGSLGVIIVDWEGEAVDQVGRIDDYELKVIGAHKGLILDSMRRAVRRAEGNELEEILISTSRRQTLILPLDSDYFFVVTFENRSALGRAMFEARRCQRKLREEIA